MKRIFVLGGMMMALACAASLADDGVEKKLKLIRGWYDSIESDKSLKQQVIQAKTELPYEPKLIRFITKDGELKKLQIELQSDHGFTHESYYFHEGDLFFIYSADEYWQFAGTGKEAEPETIDVGAQQRFYFDGGTCIRALGKQIETKDGGKLRELLKKAENKPLEVGLGAEEYVRKAELVSKIKSVEDLQTFVATYTK